MKKVNSYKYISIGLFVRYLWGLKAEDKRIDALTIIDKLKEELNDAEFTVSLSGCSELDKLYKKIKTKITTSELLDNDDIKELNDLMYVLERIIYSEANTKFIYIVENRRYNTKYLLEESDKIFSSGIWEKLSKNAKLDFKFSFFCIAYTLGTAAAFHMLRATEDVFRSFYKYYIKTNRSKNLIWGQMSDQLYKKKTKKPPIEILEVLDIIRKTYRNPTNHPEIFYTLDKAQDLLGLCIDAVSKMITNISELKTPNTFKK